MHAIIKFLLKFKLTINGVTVYLFLLITVINVIAIIFLYSELSEMQEPTELAAKTGYFEKLYRTYRNFLLNIASFVLIF
jgi:NADH:ubiquinone oxidoreductase subunit 4 (subunit M)